MARAPSSRSTNNQQTAVFRVVEHPDYQDQILVWDKMEDLYIGESRVKEKNTKYLTPTEAEVKSGINLTSGNTSKPSKYIQRLNRAVYFNGVKRLVRYTIDQLYRFDPIVHKLDEAPQQLAKMFKNTDLLGSNIQQFMKTTSSFSYLMGHCFLLVDYPDTSSLTSRSDQQNANLHPFIVRIPPQEIINWKISKDIFGQFKFDWIVHRYGQYEAEGPSDPIEQVDYYKVWYPNKWELYKGSKQSVINAVGQKGRPKTTISNTQVTAELISEGKNPLEEVPLIPVYSDVVRPMVSMPPLEESADINIHHYEVLSAFNNGLLYHLNPLLCFTGVTDSDRAKVGASTSVWLPRGATAEYVEFTGNSMEVALKYSDRLAAEMWEAGNRSTSSLGANTSGDARRLARSDFISSLGQLANNHEKAFTKAIELAAKWADEDIPDGMKIVINRDYDVALMEANMAEFLLSARKSGEISRELFFKELVRGSVLSKDVDIPTEVDNSKKDMEYDLKVLVENEAKVAAASGNRSPEPEPEIENQDPTEQGSN